ncbi:MAG: four helix bundle protein, partial [Chloroflexota bacterium]
VEEESDETLYWLELLAEGNHLHSDELVGLTKETHEILAMTVASIKTLRSKSAQSKIQNRKS